MPEQQNIEYKSSWHDEYLKWVCGFANAHGGTIFIGKDDNGKVIGVEGYKDLIEELPNKIKNSLGITVEVNLHKQKGKYFIEIITQPYSVPISLRGRYYFRSGSTKQELTGSALNEFLLNKSGKTWDDVVDPRLSLEDIDEKSVRLFLDASEKAGRLPENNNLSINEILEKLRLSENGRLKRAAIILIGKDPARYFPNTFIKIGRFVNDGADIKFQETEEGNLIVLLQNVLNQLNYKFLTRPIDFEGIHRIEKGEYPLPAIREMLLNALVHRSYPGAPIQIRVYDNKISMWNEGSLPDGLSFESLKRSHSSRPRNPIIADVTFKGGYIDAWGRGTIRILESCKEADLPEPEMKEEDGGFLITLFKNRFYEGHLIKLGLNHRQIKSIFFVNEKGKISNAEYQKLNKVSRSTATRDLGDLLKRGILINKGTKGSSAYYILDVNFDRNSIGSDLV